MYGQLFRGGAQQHTSQAGNAVYYKNGEVRVFPTLICETLPDMAPKKTMWLLRYRQLHTEPNFDPLN